jgi:integrase
MLYETAARASEVLALNIEDTGLDARRAPIRSTGGDIEWIRWGSLRSTSCSNLHADEAKQYPPTLRPAASS